MKTGEIEVYAHHIEILNRSDPLPFPVDPSQQKGEASEELRLTYRYLDLRTPKMQHNIILRHRVTQAAREFLNSRNFLEIETPLLIRTTPEGARDFLVPSRIHRGKFFALPQSPQLYKQLLMIAGYDRYYQIARCLRDEDLRADRQLEHTQIDMEMTFVDMEDIFELTERMMDHIVSSVHDKNVHTPFPRFTYRDAVERYGTDKPDLRYDITIHDLTEVLKDADFTPFTEAALRGEAIRGICVPGGGCFSRKQLERYKTLAVRGSTFPLFWVKRNPERWESGIAKFLTAHSGRMLEDIFEPDPGDILIISCGSSLDVSSFLGAVRCDVAGELNLIERDSFRFEWVFDFPLFEKNDNGEWEPAHHMFTMPREEDLHYLETHPEKVRAKQYDLVLNGVEIASGSIRNHDMKIQERIMNVIGLTKEQLHRKFGFLLRALQFGAPPHGGIAPGLDRIAMIMAGEKSIREVIPFPKTLSALSLLDGSPSPVSSAQLKDLHIRITGGGKSRESL
jgi:aspartyl-tRNA synthetase